MTMQDDRKILIEERNEVAPSKDLPTTITEKINGVITKRKLLGFCDISGDLLGDTYIICQNDGKKVCPTCAVVHNNRKICVECFKKERPLSKREYKILFVLSNEIRNARMICTLTKVPRPDYERTIRSLVASRYIERRFFSQPQINDVGMEILSLYGFYSTDGDIQALRKEMERLDGLQ